MNAKELRRQLSRKLDVSETEARDLITDVIDLIKENLLAGGDFIFPTLGKFSVKQVPSRMGYNPRTKEKMEVPSYKSVRFKPSTLFNKSL